MSKYIPPEVLESLERVFEHGAGKHGEFGWRTDSRRGVYHHLQKAQKHIARWERLELQDPDSGESHLSHAVTRLIIALDLIGTHGTERGTGKTAETPRETAEREFSRLLSKGASALPKASRRD